MRVARMGTTVGALVVLVVSLLAAAIAWAAEQRMVIEREAAVRRDRKTYSPRVATVKEGDLVEVVRGEKPWILVRVNGVEGWINESSVTADRSTVLSAAATKTTVSASDRSAAGRGFSPEVEREYRKDHPDLEEEFAIVDRIVGRRVPEEEVIRFIEDGRLVPAGGGR